MLYYLCQQLALSCYFRLCYYLPITGFIFTLKIKIGNNVWIGDKACILGGVTIGDGAVIGANSVVTHSIPAHSIAVGSPARVIKILNEDNLK